MSILSPDPKDIAAISQATSKVLQDAIGETARVIVQPLTDALTNAITQAVAPLVPAAKEFRAALQDVPQLAGEAAGKVLDEVDGITVTATVTLTVTRKAKAGQ